MAHGRKVLSLALVLALLGPGAGTARAQEKPGPAAVANGELSELAGAVGPTVVAVSAGPARREGGGAGVIVSADGLILTAAAVVPARASQVRVTLQGGRRLAAREVSRSPATGLVLLRIDAQGLPAAQLGSAAELRPGSIVATFGNPFGTITKDGQAAMSIGTLSALVGSSLETDAAVNPGSFGGPLVDVRGRVVGIVIPEYRNERWLGLARAIDVDVVALVDAARGGPTDGAEANVADDDRGETGERGVLGVFIYEDDEAPGGAKIEKVKPGSAAEKAKLKAGDVVKAMNGEAVKSSADLAKRLKTVKAGATVTFKVDREGFEREVKLTADAAPAAVAQRPYLGIYAVNLSGRPGIEVDEVRSGSPAEKAGLKKGDIVKEVDGKPIRQNDELGAALSGKKPGDRIVVAFERKIDGEFWAKKVEVTLGGKPAEAAAKPEGEKPAPGKPGKAEKKPGFMGVALGEAEGGGIHVDNVIAGAPAEKAGVKQGDVIVAVAGKAVGSVEEFTQALTAFSAGDRVEIKVKRGDFERAIEVTLGERPARGQRAERTEPEKREEKKEEKPAPEAEAKPGFLGIKVEETEGGVKVVEVIPGTPAEKAGLKAGWTIASIDGQKVTSMTDFGNALRGRKAGEKLKIALADGKAVEVTLAPKP